MAIVNMHEAKTHFRKLSHVQWGETIIVAKAGEPQVQLIPVQGSPLPLKRKLGWLRGQFVAPDDIKTPFEDEIEEMFYGDPTKTA